MRYNSKFTECSVWDSDLSLQLTCEIEQLDKAHKRAKRALRQQQQAINYRNKVIGNLLKKNDELDLVLHDLEIKLDELISENQDSIDLEEENVL